MQPQLRIEHDHHNKQLNDAAAHILLSKQLTQQLTGIKLAWLARGNGIVARNLHQV